MWDRLSYNASRALQIAQIEASIRGENTVGLEHLLLGITKPQARFKFVSVRMLERIGVDIAQVRTALYELLPPLSSTELVGNMQASLELMQVMSFACQEADTASQNYVGTENLLLGIMRLEGSFVAQLLRQQGATYENLYSCYCGLLQ